MQSRSLPAPWGVSAGGWLKAPCHRATWFNQAEACSVHLQSGQDTLTQSVRFPPSGLLKCIKNALTSSPCAQHYLLSSRNQGLFHVSIWFSQRQNVISHLKGTVTTKIPFCLNFSACPYSSLSILTQPKASIEKQVSSVCLFWTFFLFPKHNPAGFLLCF